MVKKNKKNYETPDIELFYVVIESNIMSNETIHDGGEIDLDDPEP